MPVKLLTFYYHLQKTAHLFIFLSMASDISAQELSFLGHIVGFKGWSNNLQIAQSLQSMNFNSANAMNIFYCINFVCPEHCWKGKECLF